MKPGWTAALLVLLVGCATASRIVRLDTGPADTLVFGRSNHHQHRFHSPMTDHLEYLAKRVLETGGADAERAFRDVLRHVSDPAVLRVLAGKFYAEPEVSVPAYERLLELIPRDVLARVEFGFIYFLMGEDGEASRQLGMAQALDPEHVQVLTLEAALARESAEKVRIYRRILQKEPLNEIARGKLRELGEMS
ncbi:tetratricopeptide repeat protein [Archangium violaceum]|uniref:tetratricopeptide repeat protein n=1 Tax=Archangium violaceum TaxID=83451 RepID=UPI0036DBE5A8